MMDDAPVIYGLEDFQCRTLVSQAAENEKINFIVGTQSIKNTNQVQLIEFDDETGLITKHAYEHSAGEIWSLSSAPQSKDLIATVYQKTQDLSTTWGAAIWKMPVNGVLEDIKSTGMPSVEMQCQLTDSGDGAKENQIFDISWAPENDSKIISLVDNKIIHWDITQSGKQAKVFSKATVEGRSSSNLGKVRWCPHQQASNIACTYGGSILAYDVRTMKQSWNLDNAHNPIVRDLDFNPNRQYMVATCGDDGAVKFWDVRNTTEPLLSRSDHSHWVWSVRFNASYDQLVVTCSSDQRIILTNLPSVASQPISTLTDEDEVEVSNNNKQSNDDSVLQTYEDHEDSVYAVEWSAADFWTFASISFDGRLVINKVPKSFKYKQFM